MTPQKRLTPANATNLQSDISGPKSAPRDHAIYTGSFAALERRWADLVGELQRESPLGEINVLVGSNILATYLKRRFASSGSSLLNVRFHTFLDLANRLAALSGDCCLKKRLPHLGSRIILEDILAENTPPVFSMISGSAGFRDALLDTFRDLRDAAIGARELQNAIQAGGSAPGRQPHLAGLTELYRRYRDKLSGYHDVDDDFRAAVRNIPAANRAFASGQLIIYGIYDVTGRQSQLLGALKDVFGMIYFIPYTDEFAGEFVRPFLDSRIAELGVRSVRLPEKPPACGLDRLAAGAFGSARLPVPDDGGVVSADGSFALVSAPGESRSAVETVREIFRAARDGTIRGFHEAAVILRQPETDAPILSEMLRLRNVPYFIHGGSRFADRPLCRAVVELISLEQKSYPREAVLAAMELVAASLPEESAALWDAPTWKGMTNTSRFLAGLQSWERGTEALVSEAQRSLARSENSRDPDAWDEESEYSAEPVPLAVRRLESAKTLRAAWMQLMKASSGWPAGLSWTGWADFIDRRLEPLLGVSGDWSAFSAVLDEIRSLEILENSAPGDATQGSKKNGKPAQEWVPLERLKSALAQSIEGLSSPQGQFQRSGVNILSTSAARGLRFPLVIIPGLEEGRFPAKLRQDPLLLDTERCRLGNLPLKSKRAEEERLLFDMAARSAERRLVLMTSRLDESADRERIPSQFFLRVAAAARNSMVTIRDLAEGTVPGFRSVSLDNPAPIAGEPAVDEGEIRLRLIAADRDAARSALRALERLEPFRLARPLAYDQARWQHKLTSYDGSLTDPDLIAWTTGTLAASAGQVSASRMEEYAKCPYYFFLKRAMSLSAWEERAPLEGMDPLQRGVAVHAILEDLLKRYCGESFAAASVEEMREALGPLAADALEKARPSGIPDLLWEIERDSFLKLMDNWLLFEKGRAEEEMLPFRLEQPFGEIEPGEIHPAFQLKAGKHMFDFRGRVDRIDLSRDGKQARVIDYKTGNLPDSMRGKARTPLMSGERIQIAVYRGALSVLDAFSNVESVQGEYLHLQPQSGQIVPCRFSDGELTEAIRRLPDILKIIGDGIENGVFFARTAGKVRPGGHCEYCDYLPVCGKDREQREDRKSGDPAVRRFMQILEAAP